MLNQHNHVYVSWPEIYQQLRARAEATRGTAPGADWPAITGRDAYKLALVFDGAISYALPESAVERWATLSEGVVSASDQTSGVYVGGLDLWNALAAAAVDLDRARAPLPEPALVMDALTELDAAPGDDHTVDLRSDESDEPKLITTIKTTTWRDMAVRQLQFFRALRGETRSVSRLFAVPNTTNADVMALAEYWQHEVVSHSHGRLTLSARETYQHVVYAWWYAAIRRLLRVDPRHPHDVYEGNTDFWTALLILATQSDERLEMPNPWSLRIDANAPKPAANEVAHAFLHSPPRAHEVRNGMPPALELGDVKITFPGGTTWDVAARMTRDAFSAVRGEDLSMGIVAHVPRSTVGDVKALADFWTRAFEGAGKRSDYAKHVLDRWTTEIARVQSLPPSTPPSGMYSHNVEFWTALLTMASEVGASDEQPSKLKLGLGSIWEAVTGAPLRLAFPAAAAAKAAGVDTLDDLNTLGDKAASKVGDILARALGRPLLYLGGGVLGLAAAALMIRKLTT